ncbi:MAG: hypothetical protein WDM92_16650 [Caulobacteraceae bacterium]
MSADWTESVRQIVREELASIERRSAEAELQALEAEFRTLSPSAQHDGACELQDSLACREADRDPAREASRLIERMLGLSSRLSLPLPPEAARVWPPRHHLAPSVLDRQAEAPVRPAASETDPGGCHE